MDEQSDATAELAARQLSKLVERLDEETKLRRQSERALEQTRPWAAGSSSARRRVESQGLHRVGHHLLMTDRYVKVISYE